MQKISVNREYLESVDVSLMMEPAEWKYRYYEQYYFKTGRLPFGILVDENRVLRDGYISYLLWRTYSVEPEAWTLHSSCVSMKTVVGRKAIRHGGRFYFRESERNARLYDLDAPVVPGDVVIADSKGGYVFVGVEEVRYVAGGPSMGQYRRARKHTGSCIV